MPKYLGRRVGEDPRLRSTPRYEAPAVPAHLNISYEMLFPAVRDQQFNDCVSQSISALFDFYYKKRDQQDVASSRTALYAMSKVKNYSGHEDLQDDGLFPTDALEVLREYGWCPESAWPYDQGHLLTPPPQDLWKNDLPLVGYQSVICTPAALRAAIIAHGPMCVGFDWPQNWMDLGSDGVLPAPGDILAGGHEVVFLGVSDTKQAFRLRNSWGTESWGDHGYAWLPYTNPRMPQDAFILDYSHSRKAP